MASNAEMRRLVLHAADRLAEEDGHALLIDAIYREGRGGVRKELAEDLRSVSAAMALAETTLRFVAACLEDDAPEPALSPDSVPSESEAAA